MSPSRARGSLLFTFGERMTIRGVAPDHQEGPAAGRGERGVCEESRL
jgi:hypothetical protein